MSRADDFGKRADSVFFHNAGKVLDYVFASIGINQVVRTNLNGSSTCEHKFDSIAAVHNATQADYGDVDSLCYLPHHSHCNWANCCA